MYPRDLVQEGLRAWWLGQNLKVTSPSIIIMEICKAPTLRLKALMTSLLTSGHDVKLTTLQFTSGLSTSLSEGLRVWWLGQTLKMTSPRSGDVTVDVWLSGGRGLVRSGRGCGSQPSPGEM